MGQGVSVSRMSDTLSRHKDVLCSALTTRVLETSFWGFDDSLWVLIETDPARWWLHFIRGKRVRSFPLTGASRAIRVAVCWPPPSRDGEGHVSSSSSPWVAWLSTYLHLSAGTGFTLHPQPCSLSVRLLNILGSFYNSKTNLPALFTNTAETKVEFVAFYYDVKSKARRAITGCECSCN